MNSEEAIQFLISIRREGPEPNETARTWEAFRLLDEDGYRLSDVPGSLISDARFESFKSTKSMHGHVCQKPHGYHGDYEIIDRIYKDYRSDEFYLWDEYFQAGSASRAVRGRKEFFLSKMKHLLNERESTSILNVASGPCRDLYELLSRECVTSNVSFHCVDADANAIAFGSELLKGFDMVSFENRNIFRFRPTKLYDVVWCAGLFDYLPNKMATHLLKKFSEFLAPGGVIIFGNFNHNNIQRHYMNFGGWELIHRTDDELLELIVDSGFSVPATIEHEESKTNSFCVVRN